MDHWVFMIGSLVISSNKWRLLQFQDHSAPRPEYLPVHLIDRDYVLSLAKQTKALRCGNKIEMPLRRPIRELSGNRSLLGIGKQLRSDSNATCIYYYIDGQSVLSVLSSKLGSPSSPDRCKFPSFEPSILGKPPDPRAHFARTLFAFAWRT